MRLFELLAAWWSWLLAHFRRRRSDDLPGAEPTDLTDDFCLRHELQDFLKLCEKENQRERT